MPYPAGRKRPQKLNWHVHGDPHTWNPVFLATYKVARNLIGKKWGKIFQKHTPSNLSWETHLHFGEASWNHLRFTCLICPTLQIPEKKLAFCVLKTHENGWGLEVGRDGWSFIILCIIAAVYFSKDLDGWCHLQISEKHKPAEWKKTWKNKQSLLFCAFLPSAEAHPTIGTADCLACSFCSFLDNKNTYTSCIVHLVDKWQLMFKDIKTIKHLYSCITILNTFISALVYTKGGRTSLPYCRTFPTTHLNYSIQTMELLAIATLVKKKTTHGANRSRSTN